MEYYVPHPFVSIVQLVQPICCNEHNVSRYDGFEKFTYVQSSMYSF